MKQMICLLSEQLVPSYIAVKQHQPDRVWRILTEKTLADGRDALFCSAIRAHAGKNVELPDCLHLVADPRNFEFTRRLVGGLIDQHPNDEWIVNVSGGNKMMAAGAVLAGVIDDRPLSYTDIAAPDEIVDARTGTSQRVELGLNIAEFLFLYGFSATPRKHGVPARWKDLGCQFAAHPPEENPLRLSPAEDKKAQRDGLKGYEGRLTKSFREAMGPALRNFVGSPDLTGWQYRFVTGGWLESFLFDLLTRYRAHLGLSDIQQGVEVKHAGVTNEFDIAITRGLDFFYIECKSGAQMNRSAGNQIEETIGTLSRLRALRARAIIATTGMNFLDKGSGTLKREAACRLREAGMNVLTREQISILAQDRDNPDAAVPLLSDLLAGAPHQA